MRLISSDPKRTRLYNNVVYLAKKFGPYETFKGSPLSKGLFHFDLWNEQITNGHRPLARPAIFSGMWDWETLRQQIIRVGVRNSLRVAPMPTAGTAQLFGNNEAFEPYNHNLYIRRVLAGDHYVINNRMVDDLIKCGLWNQSLGALTHKVS